LLTDIILESAIAAKSAIESPEWMSGTARSGFHSEEVIFLKSKSSFFTHPFNAIIKIRTDSVCFVKNFIVVIFNGHKKSWTRNTQTVFGSLLIIRWNITMQIE
jgi:hypothetical protein